MSAELAVIGLGRMAYGEALALQRDLAHRRIGRTLGQDLLLLVEHPPVITLGRGSHAEHLVAPKEFLDAKGVEVFEVERGGDITLHGPGQLVGYPIYDLSEHRKDLHWFLRAIEDGLIATLGEFGIPGERRAGYTGVWTAGRGRKIASIGIHVKQWVTWHGFALNVTTDLSAFERIVPCGITGVVMTSVERETSDEGTGTADGSLWDRTLASVIRGFETAFDVRAVRREPGALLAHSS